MRLCLQEAKSAIQVLNTVRDIVKDEEYDDVDDIDELDTARHRAHFLREYLISEAAVRQCGGSHFPPSLKLYEDKATKEGAFPTVLKHLLRRLGAYNYRRVEDHCYSQIRTDAGHDTLAYEKACSIQQFILDECDKDCNPAMWDMLNAKDNNLKKQLLEYLKHSRDREFPALEPKRSVLSFKNGIYMLKQHVFYAYETRGQWAQMARDLAEQRGGLTTYDDPDPPGPLDVALNYFQINFPDEYMEAPTAVPTPMIDRIFHAQDLTDETIACIWCLMGRLLYWLGEVDKWVAILFFLGLAGSGKSCLVDTIKEIFPKHTTASLGHGDRFVLSAIYNKLLWYCTEVRRDTSMFSGPNASDLPRVIEGSEVSVEIKGVTPFTQKITTPGLLAGNEMAGRETSGALSRRLIIVEFNHHVSEQDKDPRMMDEIKNNLGAIVLKMNYMYLQKADRDGHKDIWAPGVLSQQLHDFKKNAELQMDPLARFMYEHISEGFVLTRDRSADSDEPIIPFNEFTMAYKQYRERNNFPKDYLFNADHYRLVFSRNNIRVCFGPKNYDGSVRSTKWLLGVGRCEMYPAN